MCDGGDTGGAQCGVRRGDDPQRELHVLKPGARGRKVEEETYIQVSKLRYIMGSCAPDRSYAETNPSKNCISSRSFFNSNPKFSRCFLIADVSTGCSNSV